MPLFRDIKHPIIVVTPKTNNKPGDAAAYPGLDVPDGDESFTIQNGIDQAEAEGGGIVFLIGTGFIINNSVDPNQVWMKSNVHVLCGYGSKVHVRNGAAEPDGAIINFYHKASYSGGAATKAVDTATLTAEKGKEVLEIPLTVGLGATVLVGGLIRYEHQVRRIQRITTDVITLDSPLKLQENIGLDITIDYFTPSQIVENAKVENMRLGVTPQAWQNTYFGPIAFYGSIWCEAVGTIFEGVDYDYVTPANSNYGFFGLVYSEFSAGIRFSDNLAEQSTIGICYVVDTDNFEFLGNKLAASSGPDGFGGNAPDWGMWFAGGFDGLKIADNTIAAATDDTYSIGLIYMAGYGHEEVNIQNNVLKSTGLVNGTLSPCRGIEALSIARLTIHNNTIAAGGVTGSGIWTLNIGKLPKVFINDNALRASGNLIFSTPASVKLGFVGFKSSYEAVFSHNHYAESLEDLPIGPTPATGPLDFEINSFEILYEHNAFNTLRLTSDGNSPASCDFVHAARGNGVTVLFQSSYTATGNGVFDGKFVLTPHAGETVFSTTTRGACTIAGIGLTTVGTFTLRGTHFDTNIVGGGFATSASDVVLSGNWTRCFLSGLTDSTIPRNITSGRFIDCVLGGAAGGIIGSSSGLVLVRCTLTNDGANVLTLGGFGQTTTFRDCFFGGTDIGGNIIELDFNVHIFNSEINCNDINVLATAYNVRVQNGDIVKVGSVGPYAMDIDAAATRIWVTDNAVAAAWVLTDSSGAAAIRDNLS